MIPTRFLASALIPFIVIFAFGIPFAHLIRSSQGGVLAAFLDPVTLRIALQTVVLSLLSLGLAWIISFPLGFFLFRWKKGASSWVLKAFEVLWIMPSFVYAFAVILILKFLQVEDLYSLKSVAFAWVLIAIPFLAVGVVNSLRDIDPREREAFRSLGGTSFQEVFRLEVPKIKRSLQGLSLHQMWLFLTSFTLVVLLNGGPPNETLEVGIYSAVRMDHIRNERALAFALWQAIFLFAIKGVLYLLDSPSRKDRVGIEWFRSKKARTGASWILPAVCGLSIGLIFVLKGSSELCIATLTGAALSFFVACLSVLYGMGLYYLGVPWLLEWGAWFSPMVFSLAWWNVYGFSAPAFFLCIGIQVILFAPWVSRVLVPLLKRKRQLEFEAMQSLGAGPFQAWWGVEWPRLCREVFWIASVIFALSLSEVTAVILFSRGDFEPLSVWTQNQFLRFQLDEAWYGTVLLVLLSVFALSSVGRNHENE